LEVYIAVDGDDIGNHIEYLMLSNKRDALMEFSLKYKEGMDWFIRKIVESMRATIILAGGDNVLLSSNNEMFSVSRLEELRSEFQKRVGHTLSIGIGDSIRRAYLALKLAKTSGKNQTRLFEELGDV